MSDLEDSFGRISVLEDDEEITQKQVLEDIRTYGSRPKPPEAVDVDEDNRLANMTLPPKRNATQFEEAVDRPAKVRRKGENKAYNYQAVTAIDWNIGASPLDAWLNQSAMPSTAPSFEQKTEDISKRDSLAQEIEEIKVFRNVHIAIAPEPREDQNAVAVDGFKELELNAQIYYRNIMDRYPRLPSYLALRLARANRDRAERLRQQKFWRQTSQTSSGFDVVYHRGDVVPQPPQTMMGQFNARTINANVKQKKHKCKICEKSFTRSESLHTHMYGHTGRKRKQKAVSMFRVLLK